MFVVARAWGQHRYEITLTMRGVFDRLFSPHAIAVIGASQDLSSISGQPLASLKEHGYTGRIYPVNPRYQEIAGLKCYPSVAALPETPDLAMFLIKATSVPGALRECGERCIPFALIISSGFSEIGSEGAKLQLEIIEIAQQYAIRVVGPNCQGMMNVAKGMFAGFGAAFQIPKLRAGPVSLVTQSGGFGFAVVSMAEESGVGFRHVVCTGNEAGISTLEFMRFFIDDPETRIIAAYVEGLKDAHCLLEVGDMALMAAKPIMIWKVGNSEVGQRAAISHTANLGGAAALYRAAFRQRGILEVDDVQDLADFNRAFLYGREPRGLGVGIVTLSGGAGVVMADACTKLGLDIPSLSMDSERRLREIVPAFGSVFNPVDITGSIFNDPEMLRKVLLTIIEERNVHSLVVITALVQGRLAVQLASEIIKLNRITDKPIMLCWSAREELAKDAYALVDAERIPRYPTPVRVSRSLAALTTFMEARRKCSMRNGARITSVKRPKAHKMFMGGSGVLTEHRAKQVLAQYGIPVTRERIALSREEAGSISVEMGFPVALKVSSPDIPHKTEARALRMGLNSAEEVESAYDEIIVNARSFKIDARIEGVLVQEMVKGGIETIAGITNDSMFGPALMFGLGGIFAEVLDEVTFRVCPVTFEEAMEMIHETKGYAVLAGARGTARSDIDALADTLVKLSALAMDLTDHLAELDINPLIVLAEGEGVKAVDALVRPVHKQ